LKSSRGERYPTIEKLDTLAWVSYDFACALISILTFLTKEPLKL
jgi:hypothetical protein